MGDKNGNDRVVSPESVLIYIKCAHYDISVLSFTQFMCIGRHMKTENDNPLSKTKLDDKVIT